jgi:hypothetical protein
MVELATLQAVSYIIGSIGVFVAAVYYVLNIQNNRRNQELMLKAQQQTLETRQAQMFMSIYQTDYSNDFLECLYKVMEMEIKDVDDWKKMRRDKEMYKAWTMVASYLEGIGVLVRENLVDIRLVSEMSSGFIQWFWERFGPGILQCREELNFPRFLIEAEYLAERVRDFGSEHPELGIVSPDFAAHVTSPGSRVEEYS